MSEQGRPSPDGGPARAFRAGVLSIGCFVRGLPLFFSASPRTPLRALCILALDLVQVLRDGHSLSISTRQQLAAFLDFEACANAELDCKKLCAAEYQEVRQRLENAGLQAWIDDYLNRLRELETKRPAIGGDSQRFEEVRVYREAVARLDFAALVAIARNGRDIEEGIEITYRERDVATLWQMAMQCQIADDLLDYKEDLSAGLPSFMTAVASPSLAIKLTEDQARSYGAGTGRTVFPLRVALFVLTGLATLGFRFYEARAALRRPRSQGAREVLRRVAAKKIRRAVRG